MTLESKLNLQKGGSEVSMKIQWLQKKSYMVWIAALLLAMTGLPNCVSAAEPSATAAIEIENRITGDTPKKKAKFTFVLEPAKPDSPVPAKGTSLTITGKGKGKFGTLSYTQPGEYVYTVREETEELSGYTFDTAVYQIKVSALYDDGGRLYTQMSVKKSGAKAKSGAIVFKNKYKTPKKKKVSPEVPLPSTETPKIPAPSGTAPGNQERSSAVKTGDDNRLFFWYTLLFMSGIITVISAGKARKGRFKKRKKLVDICKSL